MKTILVAAALADVMPCGSHHRPPDHHRYSPEQVVQVLIDAANNDSDTLLGTLCQSPPTTLAAYAEQTCELTKKSAAWPGFAAVYKGAKVVDPIESNYDSEPARATVKLDTKHAVHLVKISGEWFLDSLE